MRAVYAFAILATLVLVRTAPAESIRFPTPDPLPSKAGSAFEFSERFKDAAAIDLLIASNPAGLGESLSRFLIEYRGRILNLSADAVAVDYIDSLMTMRDARITVTFMQARYREKAPFVAWLQSAKGMARMPDGSRKLVPLVASSLLAQIQAHLSGARLQSETIRQVGGNYHADMEGECPFESGPITLTQQEFVVEATRGEELLLTGAVGGEMVAFLAHELQFGSVAKTGASEAALVIPDRPSIYYLALLDKDQISMTGNDRACAVTLTHR
ncbi:MAG: hypothetical protein AB7N54_05790 [Alphaproteobacteria bacterium]